MIGIILYVAVALMAASIGGIVGALLEARREKLELWSLQQQLKEARAQRDRLNTENDQLSHDNADYHQALNECQARLMETELGSLAQVKDRDEEIARLHLQLTEARKPRKRARAGQAVTTGEDGAR